jgi:hypothetical protein
MPKMGLLILAISLNDRFVIEVIPAGIPNNSS